MKFADIRRELLLSLYQRGAVTREAAIKQSDLSPYKLEADTSRVELVLKNLEKEGLVGHRNKDYLYLTVPGAYEAELVANELEGVGAVKGNKIAIVSIILSVYIALIAFLPSVLKESFDNGCGYIHGYKFRDDASFYCGLLRDDGNNPKTVEGLLTSFWFWVIFLGFIAAITAKRLLNTDRSAR